MILTRSFYLNKIRDYYDVSKIKLLIGVRGCGKTTIIQSIMNDLLNNNVPKNQIIYLNFENIYFNNKPTNYNIKHLQKYPADKTKRIYLFIDEIYVINNYEEVINDLLVNYPNLSLFISSSNQNILNNNSINLIKDNIIIFNIMPFSYQEYLEYYKVNNLSLPDNPIDDFLKYGGMPSRFEKRINIESEIKEYSMNLYMNIVDKSICDFNLNIDKSNFLILSKFIFTHATKDFSTLKIMNEYNQYGDNKIFREHIYRCVNKLSDACMISRVKRYEYSTKKYLKSIERQYIVDNIFYTINKFYYKIDYKGALINTIYNELIRREYMVYTCKTYKDVIDFMIVKENKKCYIQVAYMLKELEDNHDFEVFGPIKEKVNKYIFSLDTEDFSKDGIININIEEWLKGNIDIELK